MLHPSGLSTHREILQNSPNRLRIVIPFPFERDACCSASHTRPNIGIRVKKLEEPGKSFHVMWILQNETVNTIVNVVRDTRDKPM